MECNKKKKKGHPNFPPICEGSASVNLPVSSHSITSLDDNTHTKKKMSPSPITPTERVLATVELLELILLQVDMQTILTSAVRTCHFWRDVTRDSPQLQTLLFFRPETRLPTGGHGDRIPIRPRKKNPLLLRRFENLLSSSSTTADLVRPVQSETILRPEASWRAMLVQQPPARTVGVWTVEMGCHLQQGFEIATETLPLDYDNNTSFSSFSSSSSSSCSGGGVRMQSLVEYAGSLAPGYSWNMLWGEEGLGEQRLAQERNSLFFRKAGACERTALVDLWRDSDMVVKLTRWSGAR